MQIPLTAASFLLLLVCSLILVGYVVERFLYFRHVKREINSFLYEVDSAVKEKDFQEAIRLCEAKEGSYARILLSGLTRLHQEKQPVSEAMSLTVTEEQLYLEKNLPFIGTIAVISPFLGLFGTILGIIHAFQSIAQKGNMGAAVLSSGIAEALYSTAMGLMIAIAAVIFYNYFRYQIRVLVTEWESLASRFLELIFSLQGKVA